MTLQRAALFIAAALFSALTLAGCAKDKERPNVLLISVDSLRADRLGCYGYDRPTSPNIDELAAEGTRFEKAYSPSSWTLPSVMSILTGLYPSAHGVEHFLNRLGPETPTLGSDFKIAGYSTYAAISHVVLDPKQFDTGRGFDKVNFYQLNHWKVSSPRYTADAQEWIRTQTGKKHPWFAWLHYFDPHYNYIPQETEKDFYKIDYLSRDPKDYDIGQMKMEAPGSTPPDVLDYLSEMYDGEIAFTDSAIGDLLNTLRELGVYENTLIVFTADHGEALGENGWLGHTHVIYDVVSHVPLIVRIPESLPNLRAKAPAVVSKPVSTVDIAPSVLDWLSMPKLPVTDGENLFDPPGKRERLIVTETNKVGLNAAGFIAGHLGEWKFVANRLDPEAWLFNLADDPGETTNVIDKHPEIAQDIACRLAAWSQRKAISQVSAVRTTMGDDDYKALKDLGYLGHGGDSKYRDAPHEGVADLMETLGFDCGEK